MSIKRQSHGQGGKAGENLPAQQISYAPAVNFGGPAGPFFLLHVDKGHARKNS